MVLDGLATGLKMFVALKLVFGLQMYVVAPEAPKVVELPLQIVTADPALTVGNGFTVTTTLDVPVHPFVVPVTV